MIPLSLFRVVLASLLTQIFECEWMNWALESPGFYTFHPTFTTIIIINSSYSSTSSTLQRDDNASFFIFYFILLQLFAVYILFPLCLRARHASRCVNFIFSNFMHHQAPKASTSTHKRAGLDTFQGLFSWLFSIYLSTTNVRYGLSHYFCAVVHMQRYESLFYHAWQGSYGQKKWWIWFFQF